MRLWLKNYWLNNVLFILLMICALPSKAQINLIKDGSFEDTLTNWNWNFKPVQGYLNSWEWFLGIQNPNGLGSAVLMTTIANNIAYQLPNSIFIINPHSGYNAEEMVTHYDLDKTYFPNIGWNILNMRTPIRTKLKSKLIAGKQYCGTIWVANQARTTYYNTNGMGMYFDNGKLDTVITALHDSSGIYGGYCNAQVISYQVISDSANWTKVQGSFTANGTEEYVTIGNWLTDITQTKLLNGPAAGQLPGQFFSEYIIDDASLIPLDIHHWLHDTMCTIGDSVWVGLDWRDYSEGKWYTANMQYLQTGQGFWYKPTQAVTKFIQSIDVCGALKYDTMTVYAYPLSNVQFAMNPNRVQLKVFPNPATNVVTISVNNLMNQPVIITNTSGQIVLQQNLQHPTITIGISQWPSGIYIVRYAGEVKKLVVQ